MLASATGERLAWCVCVTNRPQQKGHVLANFWRQSHRNKRLLVVENGDSLGAYDGDPWRLQAKGNIGQLRNAALEFVRSFDGEAIVCWMDDDDWYGQDYVTEHASLATEGVAWVKAGGWYSFDSGLFWLRPPCREGAPCPIAYGSTIGCLVGCHPWFLEVACGEETGLSARGGVHVLRSSTRNFVYNRSGDPLSHTWKASQRKILQRYGGHIWHGPCSPLDVVDGIPFGPLLKRVRHGL